MEGLLIVLAILIVWNVIIPAFLENLKEAFSSKREPSKAEIAAEEEARRREREAKERREYLEREVIAAEEARIAQARRDRERNL